MVMQQIAPFQIISFNLDAYYILIYNKKNCAYPHEPVNKIAEFKTSIQKT